MLPNYFDYMSFYTINYPLNIRHTDTCFYSKEKYHLFFIFVVFFRRRLFWCASATKQRRLALTFIHVQVYNNITNLCFASSFSIAFAISAGSSVVWITSFLTILSTKKYISSRVHFFRDNATYYLSFFFFFLKEEGTIYP